MGFKREFICNNSMILKIQSIDEQFQNLTDSIVSLVTNDGRQMVGLLRGFDQQTNLILEQCHERIYHVDAVTEVIELGLCVVRGDNIALLGELDQELDLQLDLRKIRAQSLKSIFH